MKTFYIDIFEEDVTKSLKVIYSHNNIDYCFYKNDIKNALNDLNCGSIYTSLGAGFYIIKIHNKYYLKDNNDDTIFSSNSLDYFSWNI